MRPPRYCDNDCHGSERGGHYGGPSESVRERAAVRKVVRLPGAEHYVFLSNEAEVLREMNSFLEHSAIDGYNEVHRGYSPAERFEQFCNDNPGACG